MGVTLNYCAPISFDKSEQISSNRRIDERRLLSFHFKLRGERLIEITPILQQVIILPLAPHEFCTPYSVGLPVRLGGEELRRERGGERIHTAAVANVSPGTYSRTSRLTQLTARQQAAPGHREEPRAESLQLDKVPITDFL